MTDSNEKKEKPDRRELRPIVIYAEKQKSTFVLGHNEIYNVDNVKINFTAPNNISICLNISEREYTIAKEKFLTLVQSKIKQNQQSITFDNNETKDLYDYFEHLQVSLIFAYTAVEAFGNIAIPENFTLEKINNKKVKEIWTKESIERWLPTTEKIKDIIPEILNVSSPKTEPFWEDFKKLEDIRNEIIHQKTVSKEVNVSSKYLNEFFSKKIFDIIRSGYLVVNYFCSNVEFAHIYFPLDIGTMKQKPLVLDDFENYFAAIDDKEE